MRITLLDTQDSSSKYSGVQVEDAASLRAVLEDLQHREPFILELEGENGIRLIAGIGGPVGCIQFSTADGEPPYLVALSKAGEPSDRKDGAEFLCAGTLTPVPESRCVPFSVLKSVVSHFAETGERSSEVDWEEV
jgi:hypothetical protein